MALEDGTIMPPYLCLHLEPDQVCMQDAECTGPYSIPRRYVKTAVPVQVITGLAHIEEDGMEDRLPHGNELLKQILLKGGVPRSSIRAKDMHIVMELDEKK